MTAAIYFQPDAYSTSGPKLMGRHSAGESFLRGYLRYGQPPEFSAFVDEGEHGVEFANRVRAAGRAESVKILGSATYPQLAQAGALFFPGPSLGPLAWRRALVDRTGWSLCGITHTTASATAMDSITELLTAPVMPWDALICTSAAVKANVECVLRAHGEYLEDRFGGRGVALPALPIIPLGVHADDFSFSEQERAVARGKLGAGEKDHVVLFFGRLSFHAKAHPLAMYQALESASRSLPAGERIILVECGSYAGQPIQRAFQEAATAAMPSVRVVSLEGRKAENPRIAWAGADVFCSLSDNIQEAFGLTPVEAMAAGLPVVVSDWDGYKDTVRDGVDGFRVPTLTPPLGLGADLAWRHALGIDTYDAYCGLTCSFVGIDVKAAADAFRRLFESPDLRLKMGAAGRQRVKEEFDWRVIIPKYAALWSELAKIRKTHAGGPKPVAHPWPARMDPFTAFANYPTEVLREETVLVLVDASVAVAQQRATRWRRLAMVNFAQGVLPTEGEIVKILEAAASGRKPAVLLVQGLAQSRQAIGFRGLVWLVKLGILRVDS